jgi:HK97 family phage major capsid protein
VAQRIGKDPQGFFVPVDYMRRSLASLHPKAARDIEARALNTSTVVSGGGTVQTDVITSEFIDVLRNRMVLAQAGARILSDLQGNLSIPGASASTGMTWVNEGANVAVGDPTMIQVQMSPKSGGVYTELTRRLLAQSSLDVEAFVRQEQGASIALGLDGAGLHGSGIAPEPRGVANTAGIGAVVGGANGAAPTWGNLVQLETEVAIDNADVSNLAYIVNAATRG